MKLAAHEPAYLPPISFFQKLVLCDVFVLADDFQFSSRGNINRTRIKTSAGPAWMTVPILTKGRQRQLIGQVEINRTRRWRRRHWRTLRVNYTYAAYFDQFADELETVYARDWRLLIELNLALIAFLLRSLGLQKPILRSSAFSLRSRGNERLFDLLAATKCKSYLADPIFTDRLHPDEFHAAGYELSFLQSQTRRYHQQFGDFVENLSCIDLLFNEGPDALSFLTG